MCLNSVGERAQNSDRETESGGGVRSNQFIGGT